MLTHGAVSANSVRWLLAIYDKFNFLSDTKLYYSPSNVNFAKILAPTALYLACSRSCPLTGPLFIRRQRTRRGIYYFKLDPLRKQGSHTERGISSYINARVIAAIHQARREK